MIDKAAADVSGCTIIFVVVIVIIRCKIINKKLNAPNFILFLNNQVITNPCRSLSLRCLRRGSAGPSFLGLWARIRPCAWISSLV